MDRTAVVTTTSGRRECGVCWQVYDPALGDSFWQVAPGTPFEALPAHWTCPNCAAEQSKFLVLGDE
jgi:rubredoxin